MTSATIAPPGTARDDETVGCPNCRKLFEPAIDRSQPPRLQGAKCPHCGLHVPVARMREVELA